MKAPLSRIVASRYAGRNLPVALVLPDGGRVPLSEAPEIDIYARTWNGLRALASPELGRLARAYVHNDIDFSGGARRVLNVAEALVGSVSHGSDAARSRFLAWWHQRRGNKANIQHHYDVSNAFYRLWLDERLAYSCAYLQTDGVSATAVTLSQNQFDYVSGQIAERGLTGRVSVRLIDFSELPADRLYDKIPSITMLAHTGVL